MKCQHQILGIHWCDFVSNVDITYRSYTIGRKPGGPSHLDSDVPAHMAPHAHRFHHHHNSIYSARFTRLANGALQLLIWSGHACKK